MLLRLGSLPGTVYRAVPAALAVDITVTAPVFGIYGFSWLPNLEGFQFLTQVFLNAFLPKTSSSFSSEALSFEASHSLVRVADCSGHASESSLISATLFDNASFLRSSAGSRARGGKRSLLA